jgi:hypothetical protein
MWHAWDRRKVNEVLVGKPEGKRPLGKPRRRREDRIRMDLKETGGGGGVRIGSDQLRIGTGDELSLYHHIYRYISID